MAGNTFKLFRMSEPSTQHTGLWTMKATSEEADGAFSLWEDQIVPGKTTPLHTHPTLDETIIVLEGDPALR